MYGYLIYVYKLMVYRILLLDDESAICEITGIFMKKLGYMPVITSSGEDTIEEYRRAMEEGKRFDLVILDLSIPGGLGGKEVIAALREMDPSVRALVSSGDANDPAVMHYVDYGFSGVLMKPYNKAGLDAAIRTGIGLA
jgi:DNA-binding response OmpR family regulator